MEKEIFPILAVNNPKLKPYIDIFQYYPENITQQPLGILIGFFEIRNYSEDSAYIVNFLNSVLKKEYYQNPKRPVQESFDSALHKVNLALSELVKHENIDWLGKIDSAICVLEKNCIYFSVTGNAKILLHRNSVLTDIAEGLAPDLPEPHPLKTFINVSNGRLEKNDKIIVSSDDLFSVFSFEELKKNISRFDKEKFAQLLKTAITNELDLAGTIVIDISETSKTIPKKKTFSSPESEKNLNVFSEKAFSQEKRKAVTNPSNKIKETILHEINTENGSLEENEYTDKKTGHIYIQSNEPIPEKTTPFQEQIQLVKEISYDFSYNLKEFFKKQFLSAWKKTKKTLSDVFSYDYTSKIKFIKEKIAEKKQSRNEIEKSKQTIQEINNTAKKNSSKNKVGINETNFQNWRFYKKIYQKIITNSNKKNIDFKNLINKLTFFLKFLPNFFLIKKLFLKLNLKQKIIIFGILLAIIIVPFAFLKINQPPKKSSTMVETTPSPIKSATEKYSLEKNIIFIQQIEKIKNISNILEIFSLNGKICLVGTDRLFLLNENSSQEFSWSTEYGSAKTAAYMQDLDLIFILTKNNNILSFSPISLEIKNNSINLPANSQIENISTYLTYAYLLDLKNEQIYRYPRAEGGFGEKTDWLKDPIESPIINDMTIDDNIYLASKNSLNQYFQGKKTSFSLENSNTPINIDQTFTSINLDHIYILDNSNNRIIQFNKEGKIIQQFHQEAIGQAKTFSVNEKDSEIYLILPNEIGVLKIK